MSLGLRHHIISALRRVEPLLWFVLSVAALVSFFAFPVWDARVTYFSENNLQPNMAASTREILEKVEWAVEDVGREQYFVIEGQRAIGLERVLVVANAGKEASVFAALQLARALAAQRFLSVDVHFVFHNFSLPATDVLEIASVGFYRLAVLVNVSCTRPSVCIDSVGNEGLQPNLDIVNVAVKNLALAGIAADTVCAEQGAQSLPPVFRQVLTALFSALKWTATVMGVRNPIDSANWHAYLAYLVRAVSRKPDELLGLRDRGIHTIVMRDVEDRMCKENQQYVALAAALEQLIRSANNLNERLHHSFFIWFPMGDNFFVDFEASQLIIALGVGALAARAYRELQEAPMEISLTTTMSWAMCTCVAAVGGVFATWILLPMPGLETLLVALLLSVPVALFQRRWRLQWMACIYANIIAICLLMSVNPPAAKVGSATCVLQLVFLRSRVAAASAAAAVAVGVWLALPLLQAMFAPPRSFGQSMLGALWSLNFAVASQRALLP